MRRVRIYLIRSTSKKAQEKDDRDGHAIGYNLYETDVENLTELVVSSRARTTPFLADVPEFIFFQTRKPGRSSSVPITPGPISLTTFPQACAGMNLALDGGLCTAQRVRYDSIFNELM